MIQLLPGHYGTVTMTVVAAGGTGGSGFHILKWLRHAGGSGSGNA